MLINKEPYIPSPTFKPLTAGDMPMLASFFKRYPSRSCDFSIGGTLMWADYYNYERAIYNGTLFIRGKDPVSGTTIYYCPVGDMEIEECIRMISAWSGRNKDLKILIPYESEPSSITDVRTDPDLKEYLYPVERFLHFSGKKMEKKRNHLNYFLNNFPEAVIEPISEANCKELSEFTVRFSATHEDSFLFRYENSQVLRVLDNFDMFPFEGIAIRLYGRIIGYSFGEKIGDTFFVHVEKGDTGYRGVYQAIASFMSRTVHDRYPDVVYLNREEDMGDESLRQSKESYHPSVLIEKRIVRIAVLNDESLLRIA